MNYTNITIGGSNLTASGEVWLKFKDGTTNDITPGVPAQYLNYTYTVGFTKAKPQIYFGWAYTNLLTSSNITDQLMQKVFDLPIPVGREIPLICVFSTNVATPTSFGWTFPNSTYPDDYVGGFAATLTSGGPLPLTSADPATVKFYWVNGGTRTVRCTVEVKGFQLKAETKMLVIRPTANFTLTTTGTIEVDTKHPEVIDLPILHFGEATTNQGMNFIGNTIQLNGYTGDYRFFFTQVGTATHRWNHINLITADTFSVQTYSEGLDGTVAYGGFMFNQPAFFTGDSPSIRPIFTPTIGTTTYWKSNDFTVHLMFVPNLPNSRPVPIKSGKWNWSAGANFINGTFQAISRIYPTNLSTTNTTAFPTWTNNITNRTMTTNTTLYPLPP